METGSKDEPCKKWRGAQAATAVGARAGGNPLVGAAQASSRVISAGDLQLRVHPFYNDNLGQGEFAKKWQIPSRVVGKGS